MIGIVGAGAAGLATAIFAVRRGVRAPIVLFEGASRPGAKILVSGGSRCNVTNAVVSEADYRGSPSHLVRRVLRACDVSRTVAFFEEIGVALHEEPGGKLFPDANRSRVVLEALLAEARRSGVELRTGDRVDLVEAEDDGFRVRTARGSVSFERVVLATGGLSLPRSGSDGHGLTIAAALGHSLVPTTPALVPLVLEGAFHQGLSGIAHDVSLALRASGRAPVRRRGPLLWTHFGVSGPVVLDISRDWLRLKLAAQPVTLEANLAPAHDFESADRELVTMAASNPRLSLLRALGSWLPSAVAGAIAAEIGLAPEMPLGRLRRDERRACVKAVVERVLPVVDSRGYAFAEATAGGIPLAEVDTSTMESRRRPGLFLVGELLDVDGRLGGFNFQWAWSSAWVAAGGLARPALRRAGGGVLVCRPEEERVAAYRYVVRGMVQGVGFRYFVLRQASSLALSGSARNLDDGGVEVLAEGPETALAELESRLRRGPASAEVETVERETIATAGGPGFHIS